MRLTIAAIVTSLFIAGCERVPVSAPAQQSSGASLPEPQRFAVITGLTARGTVLLDTKSGKTWNMQDYGGSGGDPIWAAIPRDDSLEEMTAFMEKRRGAAQNAAPPTISTVPRK